MLTDKNAHYSLKKCQNHLKPEIYNFKKKNRKILAVCKQYSHLVVLVLQADT